MLDGGKETDMDILKTIQTYGIIPVLGLKDPYTAPDVADALTQGGLPLIEITLRNEKALECIRAVKTQHPDMLVGAGTVLNPQQVESAKQAGADFVVEPGFRCEVVMAAQAAGLPIISGCITPAEIEAGMQLGMMTFKFFPAETSGGLAAIHQLAGPYSGIHFLPTGGITMENMPAYLADEKILAVGGSFVAPSALIEAREWDRITALCQKAVGLSLGFELAHIGINGRSADEGMQLAKWFADRFGFPVRQGGRSNFAGTAVECCNMKFPGECGHIAISTISPDRAASYLARHGYALRDEFKKLDDKGNLAAVYLQEEIAGFAVHIVKK